MTHITTPATTLTTAASTKQAKPITQAMIQAAGLGTRLRPLTENCPKPLVTINGQGLLDLAVDTLLANGVRDIAINGHYLADQIEDYIAKKMQSLSASGQNARLHFSYEPKLLDTGGGIKQAINRFLDPDQPLFCLSSDWFWEDGVQSPYFAAMADAWDKYQDAGQNNIDMLQLFIPEHAMTLTTSSGDYELDTDGRAIRSLDKSGKYMWSSARIFHPRILQDSPDGAFSFLQIMDKAQANGRLYAITMDFADQPSNWHHISTYDDYSAVIKALNGSNCAKNSPDCKIQHKEGVV